MTFLLVSKRLFMMETIGEYRDYYRDYSNYYKLIETT